ncbi:MAG: hypothetical protein IT373_24825 [Polyangiaceae bacterium]|nr:hypothetical protein [Polyangiaceae bacterium]
MQAGTRLPRYLARVGRPVADPSAPGSRWPTGRHPRAIPGWPRSALAIAALACCGCAPTQLEVTRSPPERTNWHLEPAPDTRGPIRSTWRFEGDSTLVGALRWEASCREAATDVVHLHRVETTGPDVGLGVGEVLSGAVVLAAAAAIFALIPSQSEGLTVDWDTADHRPAIGGQIGFALSGLALVGFGVAGLTLGGKELGIETQRSESTSEVEDPWVGGEAPCGGPEDLDRLGVALRYDGDLLPGEVVDGGRVRIRLPAPEGWHHARSPTRTAEVVIPGPLARFSSSNTTLATVDMTPYVEAVELHRRARPAGPRPREVPALGGFVAGAALARARATCEAVHHSWTDDAGVSSCSGIPTARDQAGRAVLAACDGRVCRVTLLYEVQDRQPERWASTFKQLRRELEERFGEPSGNEQTLPAACAEVKRFVGCLRDGRARATVTWRTEDATVVLTFSAAQNSEGGPRPGGVSVDYSSAVPVPSP